MESQVATVRWNALKAANRVSPGSEEVAADCYYSSADMIRAVVHVLKVARAIYLINTVCKIRDDGADKCSGSSKFDYNIVTLFILG